MRKILFSTGTLLFVTTLACNLPNQIAPTRPPLPTLPLVPETPTIPVTEAGEDPAEPTATSEPATGEPATGEPTDEAPTETESPTSTVTSSPVTIQASPTRSATRAPTTNPTPTAAAGGPLVVRAVQFVSAAQVQGTENDALIVLSLEFRGGAAPYTLTDNDGQPTGEPQPRGSFVLNGFTWQFIYFTEIGRCGNTLVKTVMISSADGQQVSHNYFVPESQVVCS